MTIRSKFGYEGRGMGRGIRDVSIAAKGLDGIDAHGAAGRYGTGDNHCQK